MDERLNLGVILAATLISCSACANDWDDAARRYITDQAKITGGCAGDFISGWMRVPDTPHQDYLLVASCDKDANLVFTEVELDDGWSVLDDERLARRRND